MVCYKRGQPWKCIVRNTHPSLPDWFCHWYYCYEWNGNQPHVNWKSFVLIKFEKLISIGASFEVKYIAIASYIIYTLAYTRLCEFARTCASSCWHKGPSYITPHCMKYFPQEQQHGQEQIALHGNYLCFLSFVFYDKMIWHLWTKYFFWNRKTMWIIKN